MGAGGAGELRQLQLLLLLLPLLRALFLLPPRAEAVLELEVGEAGGEGQGGAIDEAGAT